MATHSNRRIRRNTSEEWAYFYACRGAALLMKRHDPRWYDRIDEDTLDMGSERDCALGQLFGTYADGLHLRRELFVEPVAAAYGFVWAGGFAIRTGGYATLTCAWKRVIRECRTFGAPISLLT